jgi:ATP-binding protein involved in chromosome partitioning
MKSYHDIEGDGGSDVLQQVADHKARIIENLSAVGDVVVVGSGKGGVGKSTLTMQIASVLRAQGKEVAILDADFNGPTQARLGGLTNSLLIPSRNGVSIPKTRNGIGVVSMGTLLPESEALQLDKATVGDSHIWRATKEFTMLGQFLATVEWGRLDFLLIDLPPGTERTIQHAEFLPPSTAFVLVTIPSGLARGVVARTISGLTNTGSRLLGYIENMKGYYCAECKSVRPLFPSSGEAQFQIPSLGSVPFDPELAALCDRGESIESYPDLPSSKAVSEIANRMCQALEAKP